jgi:hypothetical protein
VPVELTRRKRPHELARRRAMLNHFEADDDGKLPVPRPEIVCVEPTSNFRFSCPCFIAISIPERDGSTAVTEYPSPAGTRALAPLPQPSSNACLGGGALLLRICRTRGQRKSSVHAGVSVEYLYSGTKGTNTAAQDHVGRRFQKAQV